MNILTGVITQIQQSGAILLVDIDVDGQPFSALMMDSAIRPEWLQKSNSITLVFKETEVSLGKNISGLISLRNRMLCKVVQVDRGELLSKVIMQFHNHLISSAITTRSIDFLQIAVGDSVEAMVKSNEIALMKNKIKV